jgi:hypothetical protein
LQNEITDKAANQQIIAYRKSIVRFFFDSNGTKKKGGRKLFIFLTVQQALSVV